MAASTSLITFRVRAPPSTRSVELYGSWDNFQASYSMIHDTRMGQEHWYGCHNFSNIICDGSMSTSPVSREGGLKMGGTYWYYYLLDNELEFHDSAQPSTTACPLMPGQLVNVLQMPVALSGNRSRNASTSSSSSELHTLNPQDKFTHPRPAPERPCLYRLNTSPTTDEFLMPPDMTHGSSASATPWSAVSSRDYATARLFKFPKKPSLEVLNTSASVANAAIRGAFRARPSRSQSPGSRNNVSDGRTRMNTSILRSRSMNRATSQDDSESRSAGPRQARGLLFRSTSEDRATRMNSFSQHRRERSITQEQPSSRNGSYLEDLTPIATKQPSEQRWVLDSLQEVITPALPSASVQSQDSQEQEQSLDTDKRLPTLPNTPSSAYPPSIAPATSRTTEFDFDSFESRFSSTTISSVVTSRIDSIMESERNHPSIWATSNGLLSAASTVFQDLSPDPRMSMHLPIAIPTPFAENFYYNLATNPLDELPRFQMLQINGDEDEGGMRSRHSHSTIAATSSTGIMTPRTLIMESDYEADCEVDDHVSYRTHTSQSSSISPDRQHYSLPSDEYESMATLKQPSLSRQSSFHEEEVKQASSHDQIYPPRSTSLPDSTMIHSENMQKLLDELSYLSELIQH